LVTSPFVAVGTSATNSSTVRQLLDLSSQLGRRQLVACDHHLVARRRALPSMTTCGAPRRSPWPTCRLRWSWHRSSPG